VNDINGGANVDIGDIKRVGNNEYQVQIHGRELGSGAVISRQRLVAPRARFSLLMDRKARRKVHFYLTYYGDGGESRRFDIIDDVRDLLDKSRLHEEDEVLIRKTVPDKVAIMAVKYKLDGKKKPREYCYLDRAYYLMWQKNIEKTKRE